MGTDPIYLLLRAWHLASAAALVSARSVALLTSWCLCLCTRERKLSVCTGYRLLSKFWGGDIAACVYRIGIEQKLKAQRRLKEHLAATRPWRSLSRRPAPLHIIFLELLKEHEYL